MSKALSQFVGKPLGSSTKLGWFGFAADPPTVAHRSIVDAALGSGMVQQVVVFAAGKLPYKSFGATDWQRNEMVELWAAEAGFGEEVVLSRFDLQRDQAITWIELWRQLVSVAPKIDHFLILGSDQYLEIPKSWNNGQTLLDEATFIIVPREGFPVEKLYSAQHFLLDIEPVKGSSTEARKGSLQLVDEKVRVYIEEEGVYGEEGGEGV